MPQFIGSRVTADFNQTAFDDLYEFNVVPPRSGDYDSQAVLPAFVTPDVEESHVSRELALAFGASNEGDVIELTIQEIDFVEGTISRFNLPIVVKFAATARGQQHIQIGLSDLEEYFDWAAFTSPNGDFLDIKVMPESDRVCEDDTDPGLALIGNEAT